MRNIYFLSKSLIILIMLLPGSLSGQPAITLDSVTVLPGSNHVYISWSLWGDLPDRIVLHWRSPGGIANPEVLFDPDQTYYTDISLDASQQQRLYYLVAWYKQGEGEVSVNTMEHGTCLLKISKIDYVENKIYLTWERYEIDYSDQNFGYPFYPDQYVLVSINDGAFEEFGPFDSDQKAYEIDFSPDLKYDIRIKTESEQEQLTSSSNIVRPNTTMQNQVYIRAVDVREDSFLRISVFSDIQDGSPCYALYRYDSELANPVIVGNKICDPAESFYFDDTGADPHQGLWYYRVFAEIDGASADGSQFASSLFLQARQLSRDRNALTWEHTPNWDGGVLQYEIWRKLPWENNFNLIHIANGPLRSWDDQLPGLLYGSSGEIQYRLLAIEGAGRFYEQVQSNIAVVNRQDDIFVPNAFKPSSLETRNQEFRPGTEQVRFAEYRFMVFNRWGQQIFSTNYPDKGWDGTENGAELPAGVYAWVLQYRLEQGQDTERRGVVKLLR
jgi:gliding motility-associated-like protein